MSQTGFLRPLLIAVLGVSFFCASSLQADTIYKWVDQDGVTQYGAKAPDEQDATKIQVSEQSTNDTTRGKAVSDATKKNIQQQADAAQQKKQADAKAASAADLEKQLQQNCELAKKNADALKTNPRVREKDAEGNFRYLAPEEHQKRITETQEYITTNCENTKKN